MSTSNLISLELWDIPKSGYFSPEALVMCLSATTQIKSFTIHFGFSISHLHANNLRTPPSGRTVLPALTRLKYCGVSDCLEDIVVRIGTPLLELTDFNRLVFEIPHLSHFVRRTNQLGSPTRDLLLRERCFSCPHSSATTRNPTHDYYRTTSLANHVQTV